MIKIGNKKVNKIMIGNKEVLKVVIGDNTSSGIVKYAKSSPTPSTNPYKAIIKYYEDGSGQVAVAEIYNNSNNTLIATTQPYAMLQNPSTGVWRYNFSNITGPISTTLYIAGIYGNPDYTNSTAKLHMVYTKTNSWWSLPAYIRVIDTNSNVYYTGSVTDSVTDAVLDINMPSFPNTSQYLTIGAYSNSDYSSGSSLFTLNKVSTTLEFDFDMK